jgi:hypothetical protein
MSALANIVVNDGAATPVARTFTLVQRDSTLATFREKSNLGGIAPQFAGEPVLTVGWRLPTSANPNFKATLKLRVPVLDDSFVNNNAGVAEKYALMANMDVVIPSLAVELERDNLISLFQGILVDVLVDGLMRDMDIPV